MAASAFKEIAMHHAYQPAGLSTPLHLHADYELRFQSLFHQGRAMSFPCDEIGRAHV